jgi:hypothetical protein
MCQLEQRIGSKVAIAKNRNNGAGEVLTIGVGCEAQWIASKLHWEKAKL